MQASRVNEHSGKGERRIQSSFSTQAEHARSDGFFRERELEAARNRTLVDASASEWMPRVHSLGLEATEDAS
jgi:hypothetical protein